MDNEKRLFVTDLDGTLLRSDTTLSPYTVDVVNRVINAGHLFTYCTARGFSIASRLLEGIHFQMPVILLNGVYMIDPQTGKSLRSNLLQPALAQALLDEGEKWGVAPFVFGDHAGEEVAYHLAPQNEGQLGFLTHRTGDKRFRQMERNTLPDEVAMLNFIAPEEQLSLFKAWAEEMYGDALEIRFGEDIYLRGYYMLQFSHPAAEKGNMIKQLADHVGVPLSHVTVFGDHLNDLGMFEVAGTKIAMGNAHPLVLELATKVIETNEEDGVARYLERELL